MKTKTEATIEDLYRVEGKAELVNGEILHMAPTGYTPGYASFRITKSLDDYALSRGIGHAVPDGVSYIVDLPHRKSFGPDASYYIGDVGIKFITGVPLFAAEVRSEHDYGPAAERAIAQKRADYFAVGTLVVWDVDLQSAEVVRVYRATDPGQPTIYHRGELAEAEPAVPGWTMPVDDLFR
jgi:Uma2 family endonuclease